jgi:hypothetical protein
MNLSDKARMKSALQALGLAVVGIGLIYVSGTSILHWFEAGELYVPRHGIFEPHYVVFADSAGEFTLALSGHLFLLALGVYGLLGAVFAKA